jgi:hypothetical protein
VHGSFNHSLSLMQMQMQMQSKEQRNAVPTSHFSHVPRPTFHIPQRVAALQHMSAAYSTKHMLSLPLRPEPEGVVPPWCFHGPRRPRHTSIRVPGPAAADTRDLPSQGICWLRSCRGLHLRLRPRAYPRGPIHELAWLGDGASSGRKGSRTGRTERAPSADLPGCLCACVAAGLNLGQEVATSALWECGSGAPRRRVLRGPWPLLAK